MGGAFNISKSESKPVDVTPREYKSLRGPVSQEVLDWFTGGVPSYGGPFAAPMTGPEGMTLQNLQGWASGSPLEGASRDYLMNTLQGQYLNPASNPWLQGYIEAMQRPARQAYEEERLADKILFTGAGQAINRGSPYAAARARSDEALASMLSDIAVGIGYPAYATERGIMAAAPAEARAMDVARFERGMANLEAQALPRLIEQYGIDAGIEEFNRRRDLLFAALGLGAQMGEPTVGQESYGIGWGASGGAGRGGAKTATS